MLVSLSVRIWMHGSYMDVWELFGGFVEIPPHLHSSSRKELHGGSSEHAGPIQYFEVPGLRQCLNFRLFRILRLSSLGMRVCWGVGTLIRVGPQSCTGTHFNILSMYVRMIPSIPSYIRVPDTSDF